MNIYKFKQFIWTPSNILYFLNVHPFSPGGFLTFLVALAQILAGQFTLSQPGMQIMPPTTGTPGFSDLPTALNLVHGGKKPREIADKDLHLYIQGNFVQKL